MKLSTVRVVGLCDMPQTLLQQLGPRDDRAFVLGEVSEQLHFEAREPQLLAIDGDLKVSKLTTARPNWNTGPTSLLSAFGVPDSLARRASRLRTMLNNSSSSNGFCRY